MIEKRTCPTCGLYHSTIKAMKAHKRFCLLHQEIEEDDAVDLLFWKDKEDLGGRIGGSSGFVREC